MHDVCKEATNTPNIVSWDTSAIEGYAPADKLKIVRYGMMESCREAKNVEAINATKNQMRHMPRIWRATQTSTVCGEDTLCTYLYNNNK